MKNKYIKKALSMFLMACILITMIPLAAQAEETATFYLCVSWVIDDTGYIIDSKLLGNADVTLTNVYDDSIEYTGTTAGYAVGSYNSNWIQSGIPSGFYTLKVTYEGNEYIDENIYLRTFANVSFYMNRDESPEPQYWAITEEDTAGGYVRVGAESTPAGFETYCQEGDTLNVYINVSSGYRLISLKYNDATYFTESTQEWETTSELEVPTGSVYEYRTSFPMPGFNITVTAKFEGIPEECTVTYDVQEDNVQDVPDSETVDYNELITEPSPEPSLDGYVFGGWYTDEDCTGGNEWVFDEDTLTSDTTLYAKWIKLCTVTFLLWDGETWDEYTEIMEWEKISAPEEPMQDGHLFAGWYTDEDCTDENEWDFDTDMVEDDMNLYSKWIVGWTVMFVDWDGTVLEKYEVEDGEASPSPGDPEREGYTFAGWDTDFSCVQSNLEVNAEYEINRYTVIFRDWNGTILKTQENVAYYTNATAPSDPTRAGYRFTGWDTDFSCVTSDLTVTAQYVLAHTVTFDSQGGSEVDEQIVNHGGTASVPDPAPKKSGYILKGWYEEDSFENKWDFDTDTVISDVTLYAKWTAASSGGDISGDGDSSGSPATATTTDSSTITMNSSDKTSTISVEVTGATDADGTTTAVVTSDYATALVENAKSAEADGEKAIVEIKVEAANGTSAVAVTIPKTEFDELANSTDAKLKVNAGIGTVTLDAKSLETVSGAAASGDITITIEKTDHESLSDATKEIVGDRPVYDFSVMSGDTQVSSFGGNVEVSLPYTLEEGEDPDAVVVYYIDDSGNLQTVRGAYDQETRTVSFTTTHFSQYVIGYNEVKFCDVQEDAWYYDAVGFIAARGITFGTGEGNFSPNEPLTRGQFIVMLLRAYGIEAYENPDNNFVDAGDTYYTGYLAAAKHLSIAMGVGDNMFYPENEISRQDMFVILYRTLLILGELPEGDNGETLSDFLCSDEISDYVRTVMETFISSGIITGNEGILNPNGSMTRAQIVHLLYNLLTA